MLQVVEVLLLLVVVVRGQFLRQIQGLVVGSFFKSARHGGGELWRQRRGLARGSRSESRGINAGGPQLRSPGSGRGQETSVRKLPSQPLVCATDRPVVDNVSKRL